KLPRMNSADAVREQLGRLLHPPSGSRGLAGGRWARYGMRGKLPELVQSLASSLVVIIQVEDVEAIQNLDELLEMEEPDVFFIGPTDLASSMGLRGEKNDSVLELIGETINRISAAGRTDGILASSPAEAEMYARLGARY